MRTDREQLDLIYEIAAAKLAATRKRRRRLGMTLSIVLFVTAVAVAGFIMPPRPDVSEVLTSENSDGGMGSDVLVGFTSDTENDRDESNTSEADSSCPSSEEYAEEVSDFSASAPTDESVADGTVTSSATSGTIGDSSAESDIQGGSDTSELSQLEQSDTEQSDTVSDLSSSEAWDESVADDESCAGGTENSYIPSESSRPDESIAESITDQSEVNGESASSSADCSEGEPPTVDPESSEEEESVADWWESMEEISSEESDNGEDPTLSGTDTGVSQPPESQPAVESSGESDSSSDQPYDEPPLTVPDRVYTLAPDEYSSDFYAQLKKAEGSIPIFVHMPYRDKLGTALAWQMYQSVNSGFYYFNTVLSFTDAESEADILATFTALETTPIAYAYMEGGRCYAMLDSLSVVKLAGWGVYCYALGTGSDTNPISPDTEEGIAAFCNTYGDLYVSNDAYVNAESVKCHYLCFD